jgi:hypothetical protein
MTTQNLQMVSRIKFDMALKTPELKGKLDEVLRRLGMAGKPFFNPEEMTDIIAEAGKDAAEAFIQAMPELARYYGETVPDLLGGALDDDPALAEALGLALIEALGEMRADAIARGE